MQRIWTLPLWWPIPKFSNKSRIYPATESITNFCWNDSSLSESESNTWPTYTKGMEGTLIRFTHDRHMISWFLLTMDTWKTNKSDPIRQSSALLEGSPALPPSRWSSAGRSQRLLLGLGSGRVQAAVAPRFHSSRCWTVDQTLWSRATPKAQQICPTCSQSSRTDRVPGRAHSNSKHHHHHDHHHHQKIRIISIKFQQHQGSRAAGGFHGHPQRRANPTMVIIIIITSIIIIFIIILNLVWIWLWGRYNRLNFISGLGQSENRWWFSIWEALPHRSLLPTHQVVQRHASCSAT